MAHLTLSARIWDIDWQKEFPHTLPSGIVVRHQRHSEILPLFKEIFVESFRTKEQQNPFSDQDSLAFKSKYYEEVGDFFIFSDESRGSHPVGAAVCVLKDHASMDFRSITIRPEYQNRGIYPEFMDRLADVLRRHGVSRIEGDVSPTNHQHHVVLAKMGFCNTGIGVSSSHGVLNHIVKFLHEENEERFTNLFSETSASDLSSNRRFFRKAG